MQKRPLNECPISPCAWAWCKSILHEEKTNQIRGVVTRDGAEFLAPVVILTTGTFLNGKVHIGKVNYAAGRQGEEAVTNLSEVLAKSWASHGPS